MNIFLEKLDVIQIWIYRTSHFSYKNKLKLDYYFIVTLHCKTFAFLV